MSQALDADQPSFDDLDPQGSFGDPSLPAARLMLLGDSTLTGPGLNGPEEIWVQQVARRLSDRFHVSIASVAGGGARIGDVLRDQLRPAVIEPWDVAVVSVGANDALWGTPGRLYVRRLEAVVEGLLGHEGTVVLTGIGDLGTFPRAPGPLVPIVRHRGRVIDRAQRKVAARHRRVFKVSMWERTATIFRQRTGIWAADGFHPNAAGHAIWADAAYTMLLAAIEAEVGRQR